MSRRFKIMIFLLSAAFVVAAADLYVTFFVPASRTGEKKTIEIQKGAGFRVIAEDLEEKGIIRSADSFIFAASILGDYKVIKAGEYELDSSMTPLRILDMLVKGKVKEYVVTIPEGYNLREVAATLEKAGLVDGKQFLSKVTDGNYTKTLGFNAPTLEGYLFPDTYEFTRGMGDEGIIAKMAARFLTVYDSEFAAEARRKGLTMQKAVTIASIIEKETGSPQERELVSSVFQNRLRKGVKLQSDPTVIYDMKDFSGFLTKKDLSTRGPHNTYIHYGLPSGPISNPGRAALRAAINPAKDDYLYFVSKNDGTHFFSRSLKEHNQAVNRYQRHDK